MKMTPKNSFSKFKVLNEKQTKTIKGGTDPGIPNPYESKPKFFLAQRLSV
ncbi:MAG: bacteriocin [Bacteroidia bacterium]|nr:bacteriocin [Bacteroidia bacterium]